MRNTNEITEMYIAMFQVGENIPVKECIFRDSALFKVLYISKDYVIFSLSNVYYTEVPYGEDVALKVYKNEIETYVEKEQMFYYFNDYNLIEWKKTN